MISRSALLLCFIFLAAVFAFPAPTQWPVSFWSALPEPDHGVMVQLIQKYNAQNPYRPVIYTNFSSTQAMLQALEQGKSPDLALIDSRWIGTLAPKLVPAEELLNGAGAMVETMTQADSFPAAWKSCLLRGKDYAIPFSAETAELVLNGSAFKKFPILPTVQKWEKSAAAAQAREKTWGIVLPLSWDPADLGELWLDFSSSFSKPAKWEEMGALNVWWDWVNRARLSPGDAAAAPAHFGQGASWILFPRDVARLTGSFAVKPLPKLKKPWGFLRVQAVVFFTKENTWDFADYLTSYDQLKYWAANTPTVPVNKQVYLSPDYLSQVNAQRKWLRIFIGGIVHATPPADLPGAADALSGVGKIVVQSLNKHLTEQEAVKEIQALMNSTSFLEVIPCA